MIKVEAGRQLLLRVQRSNNTRYVVCSESCADYYRQNLPSYEVSNLYVVPNFCRLDTARAPKILCPNKEIKLLCVSRLESIKNIAFAIDVLKNLTVNFNMDVSLKIAGTGSLEGELKRYVQTMGLSSHVSFLGGVDDIASVFDESDFLLHPALSETFGMVLVEAMARGLPCIANSDLHSAVSIFGSQKAGILCPVDSTEAFSRSIIQAAQSPLFYHRTSELAIQRARDFDLGSYVKRLDRIYES